MMYTIRNASEKAKEGLNRFAAEHGLTVAEALGQLVELGLERYEQNRRNPKRYSGIRDALKDLPEW
jgi:hypothetical protein